jgi:hypothetical protein
MNLVVLRSALDRCVACRGSFSFALRHIFGYELGEQHWHTLLIVAHHEWHTSLSDSG